MSGSPQGNTYYQQSQHGGGFQEPGGPMNMNSGGFHGGNGTVSYNAGMYDNEPPLLEELGVRFDHIIIKTQAVMLPFRKVSEHILDDADLAGPIIFCLMLGGILLLGGKVHFGYIYGFSVLGCLGMNLVLNLMTPVGLDMWRTCSVLGYCLLPVVALGLLAIGLDLRGHWGLLLSAGTVGWSTFSSCRLFDAKLGLTDQYYLVAYPVGLLYSCFVLITIF
jgi:hypothetical protein